MASGPAQADGEEDDGHQLRGEGLGGGNANLRAAASEYGPVHQLGHRRAHDIGYGQAPSAAGLALLQGEKGVGSLSGLGDAQEQRFGAQLQIEKLRGHLHIYRQAGGTDEEVSSQQSGVV